MPVAVIALWWGLSLCLLALAVVPSDGDAQAIFSIISVGALLGLRRAAGHRGDDTARLLTLLLGVFISVRYLLWRLFFTLDSPHLLDLVLASVLFAAEAYALLVHLIGVFVNICPLDRGRPPARALTPETAPTVDVLVPSYDEDAALLEVTLRAAKMMRYPEGRKTVYLLDDGGTAAKRSDRDPKKRAAADDRSIVLRQLCARLGVRYLTRPRNEHAKAGNINSALARTSGELVVVLDADHVATVDFLEWTVPWFAADDKLFLVQTPHHMVNEDPVDRNMLDSFSRMPTENEMFYLTIQRGLDYWESAFFCGSAAVLRRAHLERIGGLSGLSITEDAETAMRLHAAGFRSVYVDRPLVAGLAPESFDAFITQRTRWSQGMTQILLLLNPLRMAGLRWYQRLSYLSACTFWLFPFPRLIFLFAPLAYLLFDLEIYDATPYEMLVYTAPHIISSFVIMSVLYNRTRWPLISEIYEVIQSVYTFQALLQVFRNPRKPSFITTPKGHVVEIEHVSPLAPAYYIIFVLIVLGLCGGLFQFYIDPAHRAYTAIVLFWNLFNLVVILGAMGVLLERPQRRTAPRLRFRGDGLLIQGDLQIPCAIENLSVSGVGVRVDGDLASVDRAAPLYLRTDVPALGRPETFRVAVAGNGVPGRDGYLGLRAEPVDEAGRNALVALMFGSSDRWQEMIHRRTRPMPFFRAVRLVLMRCLGACREHLAYLVRRGVRTFRRRGPAGSPANA